MSVRLAAQDAGGFRPIISPVKVKRDYDQIVLPLRPESQLARKRAKFGQLEYHIVELGEDWLARGEVVARFGLRRNRHGHDAQFIRLREARTAAQL